MPTTGDLARIFNKSTTAIKGWIDKHPEYFSDSARGVNNRNRSFEEEDVIVLATINKFVNEGLNHDAIARRIADGERVDDIDTRVIPITAAEQIIDASAIRHELEMIKAERDKLTERVLNLEERLASKDGEIKDLLRELGDIRERAARAEAQAEMLREMLNNKD